MQDGLAVHLMQDGLVEHLIILAQGMKSCPFDCTKNCGPKKLAVQHLTNTSVTVKPRFFHMLSCMRSLC